MDLFKESVFDEIEEEIKILRDELDEIIGTTDWINVWEACVMCNKTNVAHDPEDGHPFCKSTLEYLEWKYEQKHKFQKALSFFKGK